jgi:stage II sporulation protein M
LKNVGKRHKSKTKETLITYLDNNKKEYLIVLLLFIIGLIFGIIFVNNASTTQVEEITNYLNNFINALKNNAQIDTGTLLKNGLISNLLFVLALWFVGSTVVGIPIVYGIVVYRGFCLGYTLSSIVATFGSGKRTFIYNSINIVTKYHFYSVYTYSCSKWDEII